MLKKFKNPKHDKTISSKILVKASAGRPPSGDNTPGIDPDLRFYKLEDSDINEEEE